MGGAETFSDCTLDCACVRVYTVLLMIMARWSAILALRILTMMLAACAGNASCDTVRSVKRTVLLLDGTGRCVDGIDVVPTASAADLLCLSTFNEVCKS